MISDVTASGESQCPVKGRYGGEVQDFARSTSNPKCWGCARLEDLIAENAALRRELGLVIEADREARLKVATGLHTAPARIVLALYRTRRVLTYGFMFDIVDAEGEVLKIVQIYACYIRKALGFDALQNHYGIGYSLTPRGRQLVEAALA